MFIFKIKDYFHQPLNLHLHADIGFRNSSSSQATNRAKMNLKNKQRF
jgi:hypothetical protein